MFAVSKLNFALTVLPRLQPSGVIGLRNITSSTVPLYVHVTNTLLAEPMKKKKRVDPAMIRKREDRRRRKLLKEIRRLQKQGVGSLKPIEELNMSESYHSESKIRPLPDISPEELEERVLLLKDWCTYRNTVVAKEWTAIRSMLDSQKVALAELRNVSEDLYEEAIMLDEQLLPYVTRGPTDTPPKKGYYCPNGRYINRTFIYEGEVAE